MRSHHKAIRIDDEQKAEADYIKIYSKSEEEKMNAIGIDCAKGKSMITIMQPLGVVTVKPYEILHTVS